VASRQNLSIEFHEKPTIGSKVIIGGHTYTYTQSGDLISLLSFLESRLKKELYLLCRNNKEIVYFCTQFKQNNAVN
jgi:hypothetical protein